MRFSKKSLLACSALTLCIGAAQAQSVDYTALQQTFGEPVTMSATGKPQRASDVPADMIIITQDQIRRSGAVKLMDLLQFVPGLDVRIYGNIHGEVNVHGFLQPTTPRLLVLINGRQVYLDDEAFVDWNTLPVQLGEIQQIEIIKGPGSALFGFNAYSGVINIITLNPLTTEKAFVQATVGSYGLYDVSAAVSHRIADNLAFRLSGGYSVQDQPAVAVSIHPPRDPYAYNTAAELNWQATDKIVVRAEGTYAQSHQMELTTLAGFSNMVYLTHSYKLGVTADTDYGLIDISGFHNHVTHGVSGPGGGPYGPTGFFQIRDDITAISASDLFKIGTDVTVRVGGEYRFNKLRFITTNEAANFYAADAMVDWAIMPGLTWTNSARIDFVAPDDLATYNYQTITAYSFNSGFVYQAGVDDTLRLLVGRSNQLPSMLLLLRDAGIKPSSLMKYQASWDHSFRDISTNLHASVYYQKLARLIIYGAPNIGDAGSVGLDVSFNGSNEDGWQWNGSFNYRDLTQNARYDVAGPINFFADFAATTPNYILTFGLGKTFGDFEADVEGKWVSKSQDWAPAWTAKTFVDVPDYLTMTARIGWRISDNFMLAFTAQQFNKQTVFQGANDPDKRRFMATLTASL